MLKRNFSGQSYALTLLALTQHKIWVLATSADNRVTALSMSIVNAGLSTYFQTHTSYTKYQQIAQNPHVAICWSNIQIEGKAIDRGNAFNGKNEMFLTLYQQEHQNSYRRYTKLEDQVVIEVKPKKVTFWKDIEGVPYRDMLDLEAGTAEREEQLHMA